MKRKRRLEEWELWRKVERFKKLGRVLEGHVLLIYQYMLIHNNLSFDT